MAHHKMLYKTPAADLKSKYPRWLEWSMIIALLITTLLFFAFKKFDPSLKPVKTEDREFVTEIIPNTIQREKPPAPERPKIPVEADTEDEVPQDFEFDDSIFQFNQEITEAPPPTEDEEPVVPFYALSEKPRVIKQVKPEYPPLARKANIEGTVVVKVLVDTRGDVEKVEIFKSQPLLDDAAMEAAKQYKFKPGKQRDRFVKVWMSISFHFTLKSI